VQAIFGTEEPVGGGGGNRGGGGADVDNDVLHFDISRHTSAGNPRHNIITRVQSVGNLQHYCRHSMT